MGGKTNAGPMMPYAGSVTTQSIPPEVLARYNAVNARAEQAASQPFQQYGGQFVAPLTQTQQAGIQNVMSAQKMAQPSYTAGMGMVNQGYGAVGQGMGALGQGMGAYQQGMSAVQGLMPQSVFDRSVASISSPYYQTAQNYTQGAATGPGGFQMATPFLGMGGAYAQQAGQMTSPVGQEQINKYMSPYLQAVADPTMAFMKQQQEQQMAGQTGQAIRSGAFGGDRAGIAAATLAAQQQMAGAKTYGDIMQQGYGQALGAAFQAQQARQQDLARQLAAGQALGGLGATAGQLQQADLARQLQAGAQMGQLGTAARQAYETQQQFQQADLARQLQGAGMIGQMAQGMGSLGQAYGGMGQLYGGLGTAMGGLGAGAQQAALQGAQAQLSAGTLEQQTQQADLQARYNQFLQERGYPYQQAQFLANIAMGTGALSGGTTTGYQSQQAQYQPFFSGFSDERLKEGLGAAMGGRRHPPELVGKTFDGQNIYRYKKIYRDEPELGLMADEVEDRHPDAVGKSHGFQTVDYKRATDDAVRLGGAVTSEGDFARGGYADGGLPIGNHLIESYVDPSGFDANMRRILQSQKAGLGKLGAGLTGGVYGGAGTGTPGGASYVPQGGLSVPSRANLPEAMRAPSPMQGQQGSSGLSMLSKGADIGQKLFDQKKGGLFTSASPFKSEDASNWEKAQSVIGLFKAYGGSAFALGGPSSGYDKESGEEDPIGEALKVAQAPAKPNLPDPQSVSSKGGSGKSGSMMDDIGTAVDVGSKLYSIGSGIAAAAPAMLAAFSDRRMKDGLGRAAFADGGTDEAPESERVWGRMIGQESGGKQFDREGRPLTSPKGAIGVAQVMPGTAPEAARYAGVEFDPNRYRTDPDYNKALGKAYYQHQLETYGGDPLKAAAAYNAGPNALDRALRHAERSGGNYLSYLPSETQKYVAAVQERGAMPDISKLGARERSFIASENAGPQREGLGSALQPQKRLGFMEDIEQNPQHLVVPILSGIGAMARSQSRNPVGAILEGLGAGAESYMAVPKIEEETEKIRREQALTTAGALEAGARAEKIPAETLETLQRARQMSLQNLGSADNPNWVVYLADGTVKPLYDWMETGEPLVGGQEAARYAQSVGQTMKRSGTTLQPMTTGVAGVTPPGAESPRPGEAPAAPKVSGAPKPIIKPIEPTEVSGAGYVFDKDSATKAGQETRALSGADPAVVREESRKYLQGTNADALNANQQKIFYNEMANVISSANMGKGLSAPGKGFEITADITAGLNRALRAIPGIEVPENFFGEGAKYRDIMSKLNTLQAQARASGADQRALGALIQNMEALPSLSKEPEAGAQIAASNMVTNQKAIDRKSHADQWGKYSHGLYTNAPTDFETKNDPSKYAQEQEAIQKMLLDKGDKKERIAPGNVVFELMKENKVKPADINDYFEKRYGIPKERNMARYFVGRG